MNLLRVVFVPCCLSVCFARIATFATFCFIYCVVNVVNSKFLRYCNSPAQLTHLPHYVACCSSTLAKATYSPTYSARFENTLRRIFTIYTYSFSVCRALNQFGFSSCGYARLYTVFACIEVAD